MWHPYIQRIRLDQKITATNVRTRFQVHNNNNTVIRYIMHIMILQ